MGEKYELSNFKDRKSQYPTRRKLIHNSSDEDNVFTVQRDEGTVTQEGIAFSADFMNKFDKKIYDVFPIGIDSGGTGATTVEGALQNLGLSSESGIWSPQLSARDGISPTYTNEHLTAKYKLKDDICYISFFGKWNITNSGSGYACITGLPYPAGTYGGQALALNQLYGAINQNPTRAGIVADNTDRIDLNGENGAFHCHWQTGAVWVGFSGFYFVR